MVISTNTYLRRFHQSFGSQRTPERLSSSLFSNSQHCAEGIVDERGRRATNQKGLLLKGVGHVTYFPQHGLKTVLRLMALKQLCDLRTVYDSFGFLLCGPTAYLPGTCLHLTIEARRSLLNYLVEDGDTLYGLICVPWYTSTSELSVAAPAILRFGSCDSWRTPLSVVTHQRSCPRVKELTPYSCYRQNKSTYRILRGRFQHNDLLCQLTPMRKPTSSRCGHSVCI